MDWPGPRIRNMLSCLLIPRSAALVLTLRSPLIFPRIRLRKLLIGAEDVAGLAPGSLLLALSPTAGGVFASTEDALVLPGSSLAARASSLASDLREGVDSDAQEAPRAAVGSCADSLLPIGKVRAPPATSSVPPAALDSLPPALAAAGCDAAATGDRPGVVSTEGEDDGVLDAFPKAAGLDEMVMFNGFICSIPECGDRKSPA
mmetsp:Transcript_50376/g.150608  ORF Transcript_50376/g.150608 Transcript_50376/m.150608 type:complete len:203 (+) Transcript_50376:937-1545(+)